MDTQITYSDAEEQTSWRINEILLPHRGRLHYIHPVRYGPEKSAKKPLISAGITSIGLCGKDSVCVVTQKKNILENPSRLVNVTHLVPVTEYLGMLITCPTSYVREVVEKAKEEACMFGRLHRREIPVDELGKWFVRGTSVCFLFTDMETLSFVRDNPNRENTPGKPPSVEVDQDELYLALIYGYTLHNPNMVSEYPYPVVAMVLGIDEEKRPQLFKCDREGGHFFSSKAASVGLKEQEAIIFLDKEMKNDPDFSSEETVQAVISALKSVLQADFKATEIQVGVVGVDNPDFKVLSTVEIDEYLNALSKRD